ncbi:MAG: hypothetical protein Ta2F_10750 [Termitinemataceae bacterium]|nr:MAG: hypothetical protein Ta2F_10750 [Termitinemataceae bacterium]
MKKKLLFAALILCSAVFVLVSADSNVKIAYISPNNDGVKDTLKMSFGINPGRGYLTEWQFCIEDGKGNLVRTISNKETRQTKINLKALKDVFTTKKESVAVPSVLVWDGTTDSGGQAPDGHYFCYTRAVKDNGEETITSKIEVVIDTVPPAITLAQPSITDKFFGEGSKSALAIKESGSEEDMWTASISDTVGNKVRTWEFQAKTPSDILWDGKNNDGFPVPDGVYMYSIESTDKAGNKSPVARINNIIYSAEKPNTSLVISGSKYFSPQTESKQSKIVFLPSVPAPASGNLLQNWKVEIVNAKNAVQKVYSGNGNVPLTLEFNGLDSSGKILPDGTYTAKITASYLNGFETPVKSSPTFVLKRQAPQPVVTLRDTIFSPDGNGDKDTIKFQQKFSVEETSWFAEILDSNGGAVRRVELGGKPAAEFEWNGLNNDGKLCTDGSYRYRVWTTDLAGNTGSVTSAAFTLDTSAAELVISVTPEAFSPNADSIQDKVRFSPQAKAASGISNYVIEVLGQDKNPVWKNNAEGSIPSTIEWDGKTNSSGSSVVATDGIYTARLTVTANNGTKSTVTSRPFIIDTVAPTAVLSADYVLFSPEEDSYKKNVPVKIKTSFEKQWTAAITKEGAGNTVVRNLSWFDTAIDTYAKPFLWDGTDNSGNVCADGKYTMTLISVDAAGNKGQGILKDITIDTRPARAWVTAAFETIAPNGNKTKSQTFSTSTSLKEGLESWNFAIVNIDRPKEKPVKTFQGNGDTIPASLEWDGKKSDGTIAEGIYSAHLDVVYVKGSHTETESPAFVCTGLAPKIDVKIVPEYFSPDNDGFDDDCNINLNAESLLPFASWTFQVFDTNDPSSVTKASSKIPFWTVNGKSPITNQLVWNGKSNKQELVQSAMDYPYTFTVTDVEGQSTSTSGYINVDVLLVSDGDKLKMQVPSIIFRADSADFGSKEKYPAQGLDQSIIDNNMRWLRRIAQILNKFESYKVVIEGHANSLTGTQEEELKDDPRWGRASKQLSKERAEFVKQELVKLKVNAARLDTEGVGGTKPVADTKDPNTRWKNRRVEFILDKGKA